MTAEFNKNILRNLNRSLRADFNTADKERVEMHLRATRETSARIAYLGLTVLCRNGEIIHTEICKKFSRSQAHRDFQRAGLLALKWFTDPQGWFSLVRLKKTRVATVGADIQEKEEN